MRTIRDYNIIKAIGDHLVLSREQLTELFFPSEYTCWRRLHKHLIPSKLVSKPFRIQVNKYGKTMKLYRLDKEGNALYKEMTGKEYNTPKWNLHYLQHLVETNWLLIKLGFFYDNPPEKKDRKNIRQFNLEYKLDNVVMDVYFNNIAIEIDLSESETRKEIQRQYINYEKLYTANKTPKYLIWYSNRAERIVKWIKEVKKSDPKCLFVRRKESSIIKLKQRLATLI